MKKLLILSCCLLWSALCFSQNWFPVTSSEDLLFEVDLSSLERSGSLIYCWEKTTYLNEEARLKAANNYYEITNDKKWLNFNHYLQYKLYDSSGKKGQVLSSVYYDENGKTIYSTDERESSLNYKRLIPGTIGMSIFNALSEKHLFGFRPALETDDTKFTVYIEDIPSFLYEDPRVEYLGNNLDIRLMTLEITLERLKNIRDEMNLDSDKDESSEILNTDSDDKTPK